MSRKVIQGTLAAAVADSGTFAVSYPTGMSRGDFSLGVTPRLVLGGQRLSTPADIGLSFGASSVTVTNRSGATFAQGAKFYFEFDQVGTANPVAISGVEAYTPVTLARLNLGSPITADADGICASQSVASTTAVLDGAIVASGIADLGCTGRNVVAAWTGTAIITVTGKDIYGNTMIEKSASGTSLTGVKAFKKVTSVSFNASVTAATVGTGDVLGLPVRVPNSVHVLKEVEDGAAPSAGTIVAGLALNTESTATTADVRGTYDPNSACDGSKAFALICALPDPAFTGNPQYSG